MADEDAPPRIDSAAEEERKARRREAADLSARVSEAMVDEALLRSNASRTEEYDSCVNDENIGRLLENMTRFIKDKPERTGAAM